ncbi:MAG TPA: phosphoribosylaminoimidazolesuccinocarboxamide synthase [bacterium]|nr:phosphoribosylaminoimidazolesuccinocarboxamide synthase [bacterium]HQG45149.1 phosphoribosylaminoimidazolesuccinocarboxamide synthase [bacterium]HQI49721.1 phosphoribosylaminoimidazolesuccinocarboxamide synthase [bacterium]HQJ65849.1 phosphoribosylaminoimidazolesuccinocarboxamide synthase [bacterium]
MSPDFAKLQKLNEGKTKIIYANPDDPATVFMLFKDDITAGDGVKHDVITGKAMVDWQTNRDIFEYLNRCGVRTHYLATPGEKVALVKKLDFKINLEVVSRRVAAGSIVQWGKIAQGTRFDPVVTQFHYKDDPLHDPMLDPGYVDYLINDKGASEYRQMQEINAQVFLHLEKAFAHFKIQLIDFKLEYGLIGGVVYLIDEITGGSFRLWPYAKEHPDLNKANVLSELDPAGRLDKDTYRMGGATDTVLAKFQQIAAITSRFKELPF